ncbi:hypothetical protein J6590_084412 [Homalodisca vitripennis]|nr:hypothetical protein J6590_084412 [Homalodisca vitripennis]
MDWIKSLEKLRFQLLIGRLQHVYSVFQVSKSCRKDYSYSLTEKRKILSSY